MKIALLGYGKEGQSAEKYFKKDNEIKIFENFTTEELKNFDLSSFDLVMRSPSVHPMGKNWSSVTKYFFEHCPCPIIGVTGTKGKGTTCSFISSLLETLGHKVWLVGNIGIPSLDILDDIEPDDVVVYELSSFQLWDLEQSPHIAVILRIEPDHLNIHDDYKDYVNAKANLVKHQTKDDYCIYYGDNLDSAKIANYSKGRTIEYPSQKERKIIDEVLKSVVIPGAHNRENAEAALTAVACFYGQKLSDFINSHTTLVKKGLASFKGLPHRLEFVRELKNVKYYDDNFSTTVPSTRVAIDAFPENNVILIAGGRDKTNNEDLPEIAQMFISSENVYKVILIGESGHAISEQFESAKFETAESLKEAVEKAKKIAENTVSSIVLMSPAAASFDMFENVYDRGAKFQKLIKDL
jgi:UDP-N-acetylmuramoylalanine--D-glutamate ligase